MKSLVITALTSGILTDGGHSLSAGGEWESNFVIFIADDVSSLKRIEVRASSLEQVVHTLVSGAKLFSRGDIASDTLLDELPVLGREVLARLDRLHSLVLVLLHIKLYILA